MVKCSICGKELKVINQFHLNTHGVSIREYNRLYNPEKFRHSELINFINDHYITVRYRWLLYLDGRPALTVNINKAKNEGHKRIYKLNDGDVSRHLNGGATLGVYFPEEYSKFIGLDLDKLDIDLLERVYSTLFSYGLERKNILMSFSGNKGYHIDIFLNGMLEKGIIRDFYDLVIRDTGISKSVLELRGGGGAGYKLPFGFSKKTGNYCFPCNEYGRQIDDLESIEGIEKLDPRIITDSLELNAYEPSMSEPEAIEMDELQDAINPLEIYENGGRVQEIEDMLERGIHEKGARHNAVFNAAMYFRTIDGLCLSDTIQELKRWVIEKWTDGAEPLPFMRNELEVIAAKVYKYGYKLKARKSDLVSVSEAEIREIFSIKTGNKLETESLRRLYFAMMVHSKALADTKGRFYMTYEQIKQLTGANSPNQAIRKQVGKLEAMEKIERIEPIQKYKTGRGKGDFQSNPITYRLKMESGEQGKGFFMVCKNDVKCKDCAYIAYGCLVERKAIPEGRSCQSFVAVG